MKARVTLTVLVVMFVTGLPLSRAISACTGELFSKPDDVLGQTFSCDNGSTLTYRRDPSLGDTITNEATGETFYADPGTTPRDEYKGILGRGFGGPVLKRDSILGDTIDNVPSY